jgi:glutamate synthase (NADPH/NADH) small chain
VRIHHDDSGICSLECVQVSVGEDGVLEPVDGSTFHFACRQIIYAIGQSPLLTLLSAVRGVRMDHGRVVVDRPSGRTSNPKYFAGGDCVNGGREVVDAVADGKRAGIAMAETFDRAESSAQEIVHAG